MYTLDYLLKNIYIKDEDFSPIAWRLLAYFEGGDKGQVYELSATEYYLRWRIPLKTKVLIIIIFGLIVYTVFFSGFNI